LNVSCLLACATAYKKTQYPDSAVREQLAQELHLTETRIQVCRLMCCECETARCFHW